jgi:hypothetical protein
MKTVVKVLGMVFGLLGATVLTSFAQVTTDRDKSADFNQYHTFNWGDTDVKTGPNPVYQSDLITRSIRDNVGYELSRRGLTQSDNPDLQVVVHTYTERKNQRVYNGPYGGYPYYGWGWGMRYAPFMYYGGPSYYNQTMTEGTMVIDFVDTHTGHLVWRGVAQSPLSGARGLDRLIARGVHKMMKRYPVAEA